MNKFEYIIHHLRARYVPESKIVEIIQKADAAIDKYNQDHFRGEMTREFLEQHHCAYLANFKKDLIGIIQIQRDSSDLMTDQEKAVIFDMNNFNLY